MANAGAHRFNPQSSERKGITPGFSNQNGKSDRTPITGSEKDSTSRPNSGMSGAAGDDKSNSGAPQSSRDADTQAAEQGLAGAEKAAADVPANNSDGIDEIGADEYDMMPDIKNMIKVGGGTNLATRFASKHLLKGKKGPVAMVIFLLILVGGMMLGSESLMPFSLAEQLTELRNGLETTTNTRSNAIFRMQMKRQQLKTITSQKIFGSERGTQYFSMSKNQANKLAKEGIVMHTITDVDGKDRNILLYDDGSGTQKIVVADQEHISKIQGLINNGELMVDGQPVKVDTEIETHQSKFEADQAYRNRTKKQTRTWAGSVGHWFDRKTADFLDNFGITRKIFGKFIARVREEDILDARARTSETIAESGIQDTESNYEDTKSVDGEEDKYKKDKDGKDVKDGTKPKDLDTEREASKMTGDQVNNEKAVGTNTFTSETTPSKFTFHISKQSADKAQLAKDKMNSIKSVLNSRVAKTAGTLTTLGCMVLDVVGAAMLIAAAQETVQLLKVGSSFLEAVDKTKAGDGNESPIHILGNALVTKTNTVNYTSDSNGVVSTDVSNDQKSAMQSNGIASIYTDQRINPNDRSVQTFNLSATANNILGNVALGIQSFVACSVAKMSLALVSVGVDIAALIVGIGTCIGTGGWGCLAILLGKAGKEVAEAAGKAALKTTVMSFATPIVTQMIATWMMRDLVSDLAGEHYGNAIVSAANKYMSNNFRSGGGSLTNKENYTIFAARQQEVIAENARYERETRSPFDMTSQHTFLGSIMKQIITLSTMSNGPSNIISGMSTMVGGSLLALFPSASAADNINKDLIPEAEFETTCPFLASIGAVGDAYCNPYIISDMSTMNTHPDDIEQKLLATGDLEEKTMPNGEKRNVIKDGSNLARYVIFCGNRTSEFGVMDSNIASTVGNDAFLNSGNMIVSTGISVLPLVGDAASIFNDSNKIKNAGWISGETCVAGNDTINGWDRSADDSSKSLGKDYQRYAEDQRLYASIEPSYTSTVDEYIAQYYEANPLDNSYEGILARFSGLPKDVVVAVLDYEDYAKQLAQYNPSERYVFRLDFEELNKALNLEAEGDNSVSLLQHEVVYADVRNRAFAMA